MYDFANSAFATTVASVVFNVYFVQVVVGPGGAQIGPWIIPGAALWGYMVALSMAVILVLSPVLGAMGDSSGSKKKFLGFFWALGCLSTATLVFVKEGDVLWGAVAYTIANIGFSAGNAFYNAFLPELAPPEKTGRVSGFGWALGYLGGGLCLLLNLLMIKHPHAFGLPAVDHWPVRASLLSVAVWWFFFSLPFFFWVEEPNRRALSWKEAASSGFHRLGTTFRKIRQFPQLLKLLLAFLIYNDGIETVITMASVFAAVELAMKQDEIILCFLMIQGVAFLGSLAFGALADRFSNKKALTVSLWLWSGIVIWAYFLQSKTEFWILGALVGLILGGSQSVSRALLSLFTPKEKAAEFFGFYGVGGKISSLLGPLLYASVFQATGSARAAVVVLIVFFVAGLLILSRVDEDQGMRESVQPVL